MRFSRSGCFRAVLQENFGYFGVLIGRNKVELLIGM